MAPLAEIGLLDSLKIPKGVLRKEGKNGKQKKTVVFAEILVEEEPRRLSQPLRFSQTTENDLEQANFREVWAEVSQKRLVYAARVLQKFARKYMLCWIIVNDRRTDLLEELDDVDRMLQVDLERVQWEREDLMEEAKLEVQADMENAPPGERNIVKEHLQEIKDLQEEIRQLKQVNAKLKEDSRKLKKENKQLGYDLKEKVGPVSMCEAKVERLAVNQKKIQANRDLYAPSIMKWKESLDQVDERLMQLQNDSNLYRDAIMKVMGAIKERCRKRKLLEEILEIVKQVPLTPASPRKPRKPVKKVKSDGAYLIKGKKRSLAKRSTTEVLLPNGCPLVAGEELSETPERGGEAGETLLD